MASIEDDIKSIAKQTALAVRKTALKLHSDLVRVAPVDTGFFKLSWKVDKLREMNWRITNNAEYASYLWRGHSKQWNGGDAMLAKADIELQRKFDMIKA